MEATCQYHNPNFDKNMKATYQCNKGFENGQFYGEIKKGKVNTPPKKKVSPPH